MVMHLKYRKPIISMEDRHVLIELDGQFTDDEIKHKLNHAYLNHKAPHEDDDIKKYIRDIVISKHNSVYIMNNGIPDPLASESIFYPNILNGDNIYHDFILVANGYCDTAVVPGYDNNGTCTSNTASDVYGSGYTFTVSGNTITISGVSPSISTYGYDNGVALLWELLYSENSIASFQSTLGAAPSGTLVVGPSNPGIFPYGGIRYSYALYPTNNNPLTLTTYHYWSPPSSNPSWNFSYVYFVLYETTGLNLSITYSSGSTCSGGGSGVVLLPIFYSQGNYSFNANTYYISMWQFTYT
jgi:hypothetical protein